LPASLWARAIAQFSISASVARLMRMRLSRKWSW
jgi:hypothetical protein